LSTAKCQLHASSEETKIHKQRRFNSILYLFVFTQQPKGQLQNMHEQRWKQTHAHKDKTKQGNSDNNKNSVCPIAIHYVARKKKVNPHYNGPAYNVFKI
jgi:hypothetical protein